MFTRKTFLKLFGISAAYTALNGFKMKEILTENIMKRKIPSTGELIPVIGLGTWRTFDVGNDQTARNTLSQVLTVLHEKGGKVIDSSPMYGSSEEVVGDLTSQLNFKDDFFYATKVWISGREEGIKQMEESFGKMKREQMDLMQIHNLVDWKTHLKTILDLKEKGKIRYIGITHYTESSYPELEKIINEEKIDFVQFNYSIDVREAENRLLPAAASNGTAVLVNRPFGGGSLFGKVKGKEIPQWARENDMNSWGEFFLKYILSNEAVTCIIPGTSKPNHLLDNIQAGYGKLPDENLRKRMINFINEI